MSNELDMKKADIRKRIIAFFIDYIVISTLILLVFFACYGNVIIRAPEKMIVFFPVLLLVELGTYLCKDVFGGASIGKWMLGLVVRDGNDHYIKPSLFKLILRNILIIVWPLEFLVLLVSIEKIKLGDRLAGTEVYDIQRKVNIVGVIVAFILAVTIFITSILFTIVAIVKNSDSYNIATGYIENQKEITNLIGNVEDFGLIPSSQVSISNGFGNAEYVIKVIGTQNTIKVKVDLEKTPNSDWVVKSMKY